MISPATKKVLQARSNLLMSEPFFWNLAWRLKLVEDGPCGCEHSGGPDCPHTMWTDGKSIGYNPAWVKERTMDELAGVICHEVSHVANGHPWRRGGREQGLWNDSCDRAINPMLLASKKILPPPFLMPDEPGKSAEEYYGRAKKQQQGEQGGCKWPTKKQAKGNQQGGQGNQPGQGGGNQPGQPDPNGQQPQQQPGPPQKGQGVGEVRDYEGPDKAKAQTEWQQAVLQAAAIAKAQGKLPAFIDTLCEDIKDPGIDWRAALRRFFEENAANDFSWRFPNKKYLAAGLYMPCLWSEQMPEAVIVGDSSGSMYDRENRMIVLGEAVEIVQEVKPEVTHWIYGDTEFKGGKDYYPGDTLETELKGGGGTSFRWIGEHIKQQGWNPACVVIVTDLFGDFGEPWPWPTIWASTTRKRKAPFGETLEVRL